MWGSGLGREEGMWVVAPRVWWMGLGEGKGGGAVQAKGK